MCEMTLQPCKNIAPFFHKISLKSLFLKARGIVMKFPGFKKIVQALVTFEKYMRSSATSKQNFIT